MASAMARRDALCRRPHGTETSPHLAARKREKSTTAVTGIETSELTAQVDGSRAITRVDETNGGQLLCAARRASREMADGQRDRA